MIVLSQQQLCMENRQSSKGNQLKWKTEGVWYKADYAGYEGLSEYVVSAILQHSNLRPEEYCVYQTQQISYKQADYLGCSSPDFLPEGYSMITLERLYQNEKGVSLSKVVYHYAEPKDRLKFLTDEIEKLTNLEEFGTYLCKMLTIDAFFLNEDRHFHNIGVLKNPEGRYLLCPFFDQGASLLSDTTVDYPLGKMDVLEYMDQVKAKTVSRDFDEQLDAAEELFGQQLWFDFSHRDMERILSNEEYYPEEIKHRVETILRQRMRKFEYLFAKR